MPGGRRPEGGVLRAENEVAPLARAKRAGADEFMLKPFDRESVTAEFQAIGLV